MKSKDFEQKEFDFTLSDFSILNKNFGLKLVLYLSPIDIKLDYSINIFFDETEKIIYSNKENLINKSYDADDFEKDLFTIPFNLPILIFIIPLKINLKFGINAGIGFLMDFKLKI